MPSIVSDLATTHDATPERTVLAIVARNTAFALAAQILIKIFAFAFSVYVVRRLGDAHYGRYATALAYVAVFAMLTELGTSMLSIREMAHNRENVASMVPDIIGLRTILSLIAVAGITLSAWLLGKTPDLVLGIFIASCGLILYAFQGPLECLITAEERLDIASAVKLLNQLVFMILGTLLLLLGAGYVGLLLSSLVGVLAMLLACTWAVKRLSIPRFGRPDLRRWRPLLRASLPFGTIGVIGSFANRFDTVFMSFVLTDAAVGWYNVPYNLIVMMLLLAQSLAVSMYPTLVKQYDSGRGEIRTMVQRAMRYLLLIALPIAVGGMLLADQIILLLYGQAFAPAIPVMRVLVWVLPPLFLQELLGRAGFTMRLEGKLTRMVVLNAAIGLALMVLLIPRFGIMGAALTMLVTRTIAISLTSVIVGPAMLFKGNVTPLLRIAGAAAVMGLAVQLMRDTPLSAAVDARIALLAIIFAGAVVYAGATLLLRAVSPAELRYVWNMVGARAARSRRGAPQGVFTDAQL